ncbi:DUF4380 domain-containing protein [Halanaerobaculum tunisiense]
MSKDLELKSITYQGWNAYELKNKYLSIKVVPQVGGRIISFSKGETELLYTMPKLRGKKFALDEVEDIESYREDLDYLPIGGYKTWLAPQSKWGWPPYLDLAVGEYQIDYYQSNNKIEFKMISPICRESGMQLIRKIILNKDDDNLKLKQKMKNCQADSKEYGLWDVTQVLGSGKVVFPISNEYKLENLMETNGKDFMTLMKIDGELYAIIECPGEVEFKLGTYFSAGWLLSIVEDKGQKIGYLKQFPVFSGAEFGHGYALEVFDTYKFDYFEVEVHGPMTSLASEESAGFAEEWQIYTWEADTSLEEMIRAVSL